MIYKLLAKYYKAVALENVEQQERDRIILCVRMNSSLK